MTHRVIIDARSFNGSMNGYTNYTTWVIKVLQEAKVTVELTSNLPIEQSSYAQLKGLKVHVFGSHKNAVWEQVSLRSFLKREAPDVYFSGQNIGLPIGYRGKTRLVLGLLDMIPQRFPEHYIRSLRDRVRYILIQRANARTADQIVTISKASQRDIKNYMGVENVINTYIRQPNSHVQPQAMPTSPHFVYLGGVEWRKRLDVLIEAFSKLLVSHSSAKLTLIGDGYDAFLDKLKLHDEVRSKITIAGRLSDAKRNTVIRSATAVVFPSIYEGYGLPLAEAFAQGVPVVCGKGGSQVEIGGEAAVYCRPDQAHDILRALKQVQSKRFRTQFEKQLPIQRELLSSQQWDMRLLQGVLGK